MIDDELLNKFDRIQDLPVSEEMLGAYVEGNLSDFEKSEIESVLFADTFLSDMVLSAGLDHAIFTGDEHIDAVDESVLPNFDELNSLPIFLNSNEHIMNSNEYDDLKDIKRIFGEEATEDNSLNPYINQHYSDTCAIRSQQIILRDYGINISQEDLMNIASANGWYTPGEGTHTENVGNLLELAGVSCHQSENNTIYDLTNELAQGHRIIVGVDSGELWAENVMSKFSEQFEDFMGAGGADHALIVAGVEVNPHDPNDVKVVLTDPGTGQLRVEYSLEEFMDAWKDSNCFMVSTDTPAPYQFDPETNSEIPSGFHSDFTCNQFIVDNNFDMTVNDFDFNSDFMDFYSESNPIQFPGIDSLSIDSDMPDIDLFS